MSGVCYGCDRRTPDCHGRDEKGNWRCREWAREQEKKDKLYAARDTIFRKDEATRGYESDSKTRYLRKKRHHH